MKERLIYQTIIIVLTVMLFSVWQVNAGDNPEGPGTPPDSTSSYTLADIYNRLNAGTAGSQSTFTEPSVGPDTGTMHTLNDIMAEAPTVDDTNGATVASVESGKTFWGLTSGEWALQTGTAPPAGVPKTGQTTCYDSGGTEISCIGTGQDAAYTDTVGVEWPTPRFTDNGDGTVTDNLTGLIWLQNANCNDEIGGVTFDPFFSYYLDWQDGMNFAAALQDGNCGLSDSSSAGDWRLPNVRELQSLIDYGQSQGLPSGNPFTCCHTPDFWSSSTYSNGTASGWYVTLRGGIALLDKTNGGSGVWPVRGGQ